MRVADPLALALLPIALAALLAARWRARRRPPGAYAGFPALPLLRVAPRSRRARWLRLPAVCRALAVSLLVVGLARPQGAAEVRDLRVRGRNVVLVLDISSSMKAPDFPPGTRLGVAKGVLADFVRRRRADFLALVLFASQSFTQAPLTNDTGLLLDLLGRADIGLLPDGTAIGTALAMAEDRLKDVRPGSGVVVLITDGGNNTGRPDPLTAARVARALGIRIYTIGVRGVDSTAAAQRAKGVMGGHASVAAPSVLSSRDEELLRQVAAVSGGTYGRATDARTLSDVMGRIDRLERTDLRLRDVRSRRELYPFALVPALLLLALELGLRATWLRTLP